MWAGSCYGELGQEQRRASKLGGGRVKRIRVAGPLTEHGVRFESPSDEVVGHAVIDRMGPRHRQSGNPAIEGEDRPPMVRITPVVAVAAKRLTLVAPYLHRSSPLLCSHMHEQLCA